MTKSKSGISCLHIHKLCINTCRLHTLRDQPVYAKVSRYSQGSHPFLVDISGLAKFDLWWIVVVQNFLNFSSTEVDISTRQTLTCFYTGVPIGEGCLEGTGCFLHINILEVIQCLLNKQQQIL